MCDGVVGEGVAHHVCSRLRSGNSVAIDNECAGASWRALRNDKVAQ